MVHLSAKRGFGCAFSFVRSLPLPPWQSAHDSDCGVGCGSFVVEWQLMQPSLGADVRAPVTCVAAGPISCGWAAATSADESIREA